MISIWRRAGFWHSSRGSTLRNHSTRVYKAMILFTSYRQQERNYGLTLKPFCITVKFMGMYLVLCSRQTSMNDCKPIAISIDVISLKLCHRCIVAWISFKFVVVSTPFTNCMWC